MENGLFPNPRRHPNGWPKQPVIHRTLQHIAHHAVVRAWQPADEPASKSNEPFVSSYSTEYIFLTISLLSAALGLTIALLALVNGVFDFAVLVFPAATLILALPIYSWFFGRLRWAERRNPRLRYTLTRRICSKLVQTLMFITVLFTAIGFLTLLLAKMGTGYDGSLAQITLNVVVIELIAGSILTYYWRDEHQKRR